MHGAERKGGKGKEGAQETVPFTQGEPWLYPECSEEQLCPRDDESTPHSDLRFGQNSLLGSLTEQSLVTGLPGNWITPHGPPGPNRHRKSSEVNGSHPGSFAVFIDREGALAMNEKTNLEEERARSLLRATRGRNRKLLTSGFN